MPHQQAGQCCHLLRCPVPGQHTTGKRFDVCRQSRAKVFHLLTSLSLVPEGQVKHK
nr:MAG TPA: hypothetical protein [Caudoviricetes sp.]